MSMESHYQDFFFQENSSHIEDSAGSEEDLAYGGDYHTVSDGSETESDGGDEAWQGRCNLTCDSPPYLDSSFEKSDSKISWTDTPPSPLSSSMSDCGSSNSQWYECEVCQICGGGPCRLETLEKKPLVWPEMLVESPPPRLQLPPPPPQPQTNPNLLLPTPTDHPLANFVSNLTALSKHFRLFKSAPADIYNYLNEKLRSGVGTGGPEVLRGMSRGRRGQRTSSPGYHHHLHQHQHHHHHHQAPPPRRRRGRQPGSTPMTRINSAGMAEQYGIQGFGGGYEGIGPIRR